jgi:hypothetical protein
MAHKRGLSRRDLLKAAAVGGGAALLPAVPAKADVPVTVVSTYPANKWGTPGLYPGRVVRVAHSGCSVNYAYQTAPIQQMIRSGIATLTGASSHVAGWRQFVGPTDVVGIKINPNGNAQIQSSYAATMEIVSGLMLAGVSPRNIVVFERYAEILGWVASWFPSWVQMAWASPAFVNDQTSISGYDSRHYVETELFNPWQTDHNDPANRRSYAAQFIATRVNKLINLAVLKNHNGSGVTGALKNLSNGLMNNVNRMHPGDANYYSTMIPAMVSTPVIRYKAVLHIIDGVHGLYEAGPHGYEQYVWEHKKMYFSTDAVAIDRIEWEIIDDRRAIAGMPACADSYAYIGMTTGPLQQPQYITAAGNLGLGIAERSLINLQTVTLA